MDSVQGTQLAFSAQEEKGSTWLSSQAKKLVWAFFGAVLIALAVCCMPQSAFADETDASGQTALESAAVQVDDDQQDAVVDQSSSTTDQESDAQQAGDTASTSATDDQTAQNAEADGEGSAQQGFEADDSVVSDQADTDAAAGANNVKSTEQTSEENGTASKRTTAAVDNALNADDILDIAAMTYSGTELKPVVTVLKNGIQLIKDADYTVSYYDNLNPGTAIVSVTGKNDYSGTASKNFTILRKSVTVTADNKTKTWGSDDPDFTSTILGLLEGDSLDVTYTRTAGESLGTYTITPFVELAPSYYDLQLKTGTLTISGKQVVVLVDRQTKIYGDDDPTLTAAVVGLDEGDTIEYTVMREPGENIGTYTISASGADIQGDKYAVMYYSNSLCIEAKPVNVTPDDKSKIYGEDDPELTATLTGLLNGDTVEYTLERVQGQAAGTYDIISKGEKDQGNYWLVLKKGTFTINRREVTVSADSKTITYGDSEPELTATVSGLVSGDTLEYTVAREAGTDVGHYLVYAQGDQYQGSYDVSYTRAYLVINPKDITVTADNQSKTYGDADPAFTSHIDGLVEGDSSSLIHYFIKRDSGETANTSYTICPYGETNQGNYKVTYKNGELTINPKTVQVVPNPTTKIYGDPDPELTATVIGLIGDDTIKYRLSRVAGENVGTYLISASMKNDQGNYCVIGTVSYFEIDQRDITVTADALSKTYREADPELTATVCGLVGTDTVKYTLTREAGEDVGAYVITASGKTSQGNYKVTFADSSLTILPKTVTVTAEDKSKVYGETDPWLTATVEGAYDGDDIKWYITRYVGEDVGEYTIAVWGIIYQGNYRVDYVDGTLTIKPISADAFDVSAEGPTEFTFSGMEQGPTYLVKYGDQVLEEGVDYQITDNTATKIGEYAAKITGLGVYGGTVEESWSILIPANESVQSEGVDTSDANEKTLDGTYASSMNTISETGEIPGNLEESSEGSIKDALAVGVSFITEARAVKAEEADVPAADKNLVAAAIEALAPQGGTADLLEYLDVEVLLKNAATGKVLANIIQTDGPIAFAVQLDSDILEQLAGKAVYLVRIHGGESTYLDAVLENGVLKFSSDLFSTYAIAAVTEPEPEPEPGPQPSPSPDFNADGEAGAQNASCNDGAVNPQTGDTLPVAPVAGLALATAVVLVAVSRKRASA